jgi:hypothetical protein
LRIPTSFSFLAPLGLYSQRLTHALHSLVRVSRRGDFEHFVRVLKQRLNGICCFRTSISLKQDEEELLLTAHSPTLLPKTKSTRTVYGGANPSSCKESNSPQTHCSKTVTLQTISSSFDSLFRVLFIFPSRYLFAIGLSSVFSFRWNLPPT